MRSLGHALGPARGTLCFSGAIITACDLLRHLADRIRRGGNGIVGIVLRCLLAYLIDLLQEIIRYISTMATIQVRVCLTAQQHPTSLAGLTGLGTENLIRTFAKCSVCGCLIVDVC